MQLSYVLFQIEVPAKSFRADIAGIRLFVVVSVHVKGEIIDLVERLVTDCTLVLLLCAVC